VALVVPIVLYARRNLPQGGLYYYGRYLVPELWPIAALLATETVRRLHVRLSATSVASLAAGGAAVVLLGSTGLPLVTDPATRIREFSDARRFVEALAAAVPRDAIVIAGGEGWHHGHTFNQVGGALALSHGISVLPYRSREAAYATLQELLVEAPSGRPVYLLINEATKPYRLRDADGKPTGTKTAAFDSQLEAPFVAAEVRLLEMFVHRLTPVTDVLPIRVTRDELRMGLVRVVVDPTLAARVERFAPPGGTDPRCLHRKKKTKFKLPKHGPAGEGPVSIVIVASPGTSRSNATWNIKADGERLRTKVAGGRARPRDTLGPFVLAKRPKKLVIRGAKRRHKRAPCPNGGVDEIRILPLTDPRSSHAPTTADSFALASDLGHPIEPVNWVDGIGLSRARPGIVSQGGKLRAAGPSLVLRSGQTLTWPLQPLPDAGATPLDIVITLGKSEAGADARLDLLWNGEVVATIEPPEARARSWQSEPIGITPSGPTATLGVRLTSATATSTTSEVWVRDLGVFARQGGTPGKLR
ncbi:MAG: hypothetical protein JKY37_27550, partial [Nannocystaceae bacterium]|nr:hypothetical protein [Nannocystaceae bacterium]